MRTPMRRLGLLAACGILLLATPAANACHLCRHRAIARTTCYVPATTCAPAYVYYPCYYTSAGTAPTAGATTPSPPAKAAENSDPKKDKLEEAITALMLQQTAMSHQMAQMNQTLIQMNQTMSQMSKTLEEIKNKKS